MKIRVVSDLHLEFYSEIMMTEDFVEHLLPSMDSDSSTVLVLAGDMCTLKKRKSFEFFLNIVCPRFKKVLYVYGNHEYSEQTYIL